MRNVTTNRQTFTEKQKIEVWQKAAEAPGKNLADFRLDPCGALIERRKFGVTTESGTGWEIDHIVPVSAGGSDHIDNLQALQWEHNREKGDGPNSGYCHKSWTRG